VKYLLFIFNFVFFVTGGIILGVGIWVKVKYEHYFLFVGNQFISSPILLIIVGTIITVIAFFGCCGAIKENHCMIVTFAVLLGIIFILELAAGIAAYVLRKDLEETITKAMEDGIKNYDNPDAIDVKRTWDAIQHDLHCCGTNSSDSWLAKYPNGTVPDSCCKESDHPGCGRTPRTEAINEEGCLKKFFNMSNKTAYIVGGVGVGIAFVQVIGVLFACCLARAIKREYEVV